MSETQVTYFPAVPRDRVLVIILTAKPQIQYASGYIDRVFTFGNGLRLKFLVFFSVKPASPHKQ